VATWVSSCGRLAAGIRPRADHLEAAQGGGPGSLPSGLVMRKVGFAGLLSILALALYVSSGAACSRRCERRCWRRHPVYCCCRSYSACCGSADCGSSCCAPCERCRLRRRRCAAECCCGGPQWLSLPSVFAPEAGGHPGPAPRPRQPIHSPVQQTGATSPIQTVDYQPPAASYGGFVNPYSTDPYAPNPAFARHY